MSAGNLDIDDTPVWRIYKHENGKIGPVLCAWYSDYVEERFLTNRTFGTQYEAEEWLQEFWRAYWQLAL